MDFATKKYGEQPDFYILDSDDWKAIVAEEQVRHPNAIVDDHYQVHYPDGWKGINLQAKYVAKYKDQWDKISEAV